MRNTLLILITLMFISCGGEKVSPPQKHHPNQLKLLKILIHLQNRVDMVLRNSQKV